ncbi:ankyrin repeat domain-containing protein [Candidatus Neptunochlamydia vexilliferae]|uniref:Uncharacterized protein n=1 Tax=Candidatus Neptunichlamydia vexilliferae TaxID=1651774 RepID=A0ABS0AZU2_9BACT|nr:ankyrin repeat domain-containing protein [Candidatus Neptunochlamydia vexilliferae]MBF5059653.1 hypothetical protein [Candidatus Neptunochlamydia vexilliferae]
MSIASSSIQGSSGQLYPQYCQWSTSQFSYVFKLQNASTLALKVYDISKGCVHKKSFSTKEIGERAVSLITSRGDVSVVLENLVNSGALSRDYFPVPSKYEEIEVLLKNKNWLGAEKVILNVLKGAKESEKKRCYEYLETVYKAENPDKLKELWSNQASGYVSLSKFAEAQEVYEKAYSYFKSYDAACNLAHVLNLQGKTKESMGNYIEATVIALLNEELGKAASCIEQVRKVDPQMKELDQTQKICLLMLTQVSKIARKQNEQYENLLEFLTLTHDRSGKPLLDSILHNAIQQQRSDLVKAIVEQWELVPINPKRGYSSSAFIINAVRTGNEETVKELLNHPDINIGYRETSGPRLTALALAEKLGFKNIFNLLYAHNQTLEKQLITFKKKPMPVSLNHLHIQCYGQSLVVVGVNEKGAKTLLDVSAPSVSRDKIFDMLKKRGLKQVNCITMHLDTPMGGQKPDSFFPKVQFYEAIRNRSSNIEKIKQNFKESDIIINAYHDLSETIHYFLEGVVMAEPLSEAVVYRALRLKGKDYFEKDPLSKNALESQTLSVDATKASCSLSTK